MAIQQTPQSDLFKQQLRESLHRETANSRAIKIARHANVYTCGDRDEMVYFVESGQVKLLMLSSEGGSVSWRFIARAISSASFVSPV